MELIADEQTSNPVEAFDRLIEEARAAAEAEAQEQVVESTEEPQESQDPATPPEEAQEQVEQPSEDEQDDDKPKYTRRDAQRIAEQLRDAEKAVSDTQAQLQALQKESEELAVEVQRALGTQKQYEEDRSIALDVTRPQRERDAAAERVKVWDDNRAFFGKLQKAAQNTVMSGFAAQFAEAAKLEGVDRQILMGPDLGAVFKHVYEAGGKTRDQEIKKLQAEITGLKAAAAGKNARTPVAGGTSSVLDNTAAWFDKRGLLTDEMERAAMSGQLRG